MKVNNSPERFRQRLTKVAQRLEELMRSKPGSEATQVRRREELNKVYDRLARGY